MYSLCRYKNEPLGKKKISKFSTKLQFYIDIATNEQNMLEF